CVTDANGSGLDHW
nr:immunoglobulin heavy chain junction region [Macaca mulatta]MOV53730.1 immunoglobulin heavy chain junction region [Macaca mulatta]MOV54340.1 immunoglobulin heavy chain junction region [Macaca mulatta]MOV55053.1 immunoglobulin heavy chain junction region [Macaca mulatta]MOV55886.1 immunoglobulin heavy chain junction region [Macaca mulatta]